MPDDDDEMARRVRKLVVEHAETRWLALRVDADIQEIRSELRDIREVQRDHTARFAGIERELDEHTAKLDEHSGRLDSIDRRLEEHSIKLQEHTGRFDSVDAQLRSLTQMVGQVLHRFDERE